MLVPSNVFKIKNPVYLYDWSLLKNAQYVGNIIIVHSLGSLIVMFNNKNRIPETIYLQFHYLSIKLAHLDMFRTRNEHTFLKPH